VECLEGTFVGCGGTELYYQRWRPEGSPKAVLVVLHGHGEHSGRYGNVVDWFVPRGYAVYGFDARGHGRSQGQRGYLESYDDMLDDLEAFLDLVRREEPDGATFLLGHSVGGLTALYYAERNSSGLAGIVASGPVLSQPGIAPFLIQLAKLLSNVWPTFTLATGLDATALSRDEAVVEAYVNDPLVHSKGTARLGAELMATVEWTQAHAAEMKLPCLIVHGGADRLCPPEASRCFCENMTLTDKEYIEYDGYYHEVYNDLGKERVLADVEGWLERHL
jgi:alpha-beta hydrolase superfamily lysophospholipase